MPKIARSRITVAEAFPKMGEEDVGEVKETVRRYLMVVRHVFDHIHKENPRILTELRRRAKLRKEKARS